LESYNIRLPNGEVAVRELSKEEVEYWLSVGMYLGFGFHHITAVFAAEQEEADVEDTEVFDLPDLVPVDDEEEQELPGEKGPTIN
jgi:hypothetical protein